MPGASPDGARVTWLATGMAGCGAGVCAGTGGMHPVSRRILIKNARSSLAFMNIFSMLLVCSCIGLHQLFLAFVKSDANNSRLLEQVIRAGDGRHGDRLGIPIRTCGMAQFTEQFCPHGFDLGLLVTGERLAQLGEVHSHAVNDLAIQFAVMLHQDHDGRRVGRLGCQELAQLDGDLAAGVDDPEQGRFLQVHKADDELRLVAGQFGEQLVAQVSSQVGRDGVGRVTHGLDVIKIEGAKVGAVALRAEVHIRFH
jgi:hypothetical protein